MSVHQKRNKNVNESFYNLSQEKLQLVQMQKQMLEMEHKSHLYSLELEGNQKDINFKVQVKELDVIDLEIKKEL